MPVADRDIGDNRFVQLDPEVSLCAPVRFQNIIEVRSAVVAVGSLLDTFEPCEYARNPEISRLLRTIIMFKRECKIRRIILAIVPASE